MAGPTGSVMINSGEVGKIVDLLQPSAICNWMFAIRMV
jgi:hypothetical protein